VVHSGVDAREGGGIVSYGFLTLYRGMVVMRGLTGTIYSRLFFLSFLQI